MGIPPTPFVRSWDYKRGWFAFLLREVVSKVEFLAGLTVHPSEAILDVPLCHKDFVVAIGLGKGMNYATKGMAQLIKGSPWRHFNSGIVDQIKEAILEL